MNETKKNPVTRSHVLMWMEKLRNKRKQIIAQLKQGAKIGTDGVLGTV